MLPGHIELRAFRSTIRTRHKRMMYRKLRIRQFQVYAVIEPAELLHSAMKSASYRERSAQHTEKRALSITTFRQLNQTAHGLVGFLFTLRRGAQQTRCTRHPQLTPPPPQSSNGTRQKCNRIQVLQLRTYEAFTYNKPSTYYTGMRECFHAQFADVLRNMYVRLHNVEHSGHLCTRGVVTGKLCSQMLRFEQQTYIHT